METLGTHSYYIGTFCVDVTPPIGHSLCGGLVESVLGVRDILTARGVVLTGCDEPIVVVVFDWCELRNDAYHHVRRMIAEAVGTSPNRVMASTVHPHDAPLFDLYAENLLRTRGIVGLFCDLEFFEECILRVSDAARKAMASSTPITGICVGQAKVEGIASNRRIPGAGVVIKAWRGSSVPCCSELMDEPEGLIDPYLKLIIFKSENRIVTALNCYATHPMSFYGTRMVSADFYGDARRIMEQEYPETLMIYTNGCGGNIAPGKYNNGTEECRQAMAGRLSDAMKSAWQNAESVSIESISFHLSSIDFGSHIPKGFSGRLFERELSRLPANANRMYMERMRLEDSDRYIRFWNAVEGISWLQNMADNGPSPVACIDTGSVVFLMLPGESFIQYQLAGQSFRPESFVMFSAYGDCGMGYIPVDSSWGEGGYEETESYVACGVEMPVINSIANVLSTTSDGYLPTEARRTSKSYKKWPYRRSYLERILARTFR